MKMKKSLSKEWTSVRSGLGCEEERGIYALIASVVTHRKIAVRSSMTCREGVTCLGFSLQEQNYFCEKGFSVMTVPVEAIMTIFGWLLQNTIGMVLI